MNETKVEIPKDALFTFRARLVRIIDGDTIDVVLDQGLHNTRTERLRLLGVNCPEMRGEERSAGIAAHFWVTGFFLTDTESKWPLIIRTEKSDVFGRFLAHVWRMEDGVYLNSAIIEAGHGVSFPTSPPRLH